MLRPLCSFLRVRCVAVFVCLLLAALSTAQAAQPDRYALVTILHTNDMHGTVMPESGIGGLAKISTLVKRIRAEMPNVVLIDAGDIFHGTVEDYLSGGKATVSAMNVAGYTAATVGNHEFDFGTDVTRGAIDTAVFPFVSANVKDKKTGGQWNKLYPHTIVSVGGVRVAVLGLTTLQTPDLEWPPRIADVRFDDPFAAAKAMVPELRKQADVVVVLSHLGKSQDLQLADQVKGIDFIVGGHTHSVMDKWTWVGDTMVTQAGALGAYLGRIDFIARVGVSGSQIVSVNGKGGVLWSRTSRPPLGKIYPDSPLIAVGTDVPDDQDVVSVYTPYRNKAQQVLGEIIGDTTRGIDSKPVGDESMVGNLVADAVRWQMGSDAAMVDPKSVSGALLPGKITAGNAVKLIEGLTRQNLVKVEITGEQLFNAIQAYYAKGKTPRLVVSGMTVTYKPFGERTQAVSDVTINGQPLDLSKTYTFASQAYLIMDIQKLYPNIKVLADPYLTTREAVIGFIKMKKTVDYSPEGRLHSADVQTVPESAPASGIEQAL